MVASRTYNTLNLARHPRDRPRHYTSGDAIAALTAYLPRVGRSSFEFEGTYPPIPPFYACLTLLRYRISRPCPQTPPPTPLGPPSSSTPLSYPSVSTPSTFNLNLPITISNRRSSFANPVRHSYESHILSCLGKSMARNFIPPPTTSLCISVVAPFTVLRHRA